MSETVCYAIISYEKDNGFKIRRKYSFK
jgi:hypothetical protein